MTRTSRLTLAALTWTFAAIGCSNATTPDDESVAGVEAALEMEDGNFDVETPEAPMFGIDGFESWFDDLDPMTETLEADAILPGDEMPDGTCAHGFLQGRTRRLGREGDREVGVGRGRVLNAEREVIGHVRFIWGTRRDGSKVAFGKLIGRDGEAHGIFRGHAEDGQFRGEWIRRNGNHGVMAGRYGAGDPEVRGGIFAGRWRRVACDPSTEDGASTEDGF